MSVVIADFLACDPVEGLPEGVFDFADGAESATAEFVFDFREDLFDGIEIGAVGREEEDAGVVLGQGVGEAFHFVGGQIIQDEDVPGSHTGSEFLADVLHEEFAVQGAVDDHRGEQALAADGDDEGGRFPMAMGHGIDDPPGREPPAVEAGHRRRAERLVEEDEAAGVDPGLDDLPRGPGDDDVGPVPLGGPEAFF